MLSQALEIAGYQNLNYAVELVFSIAASFPPTYLARRFTA